MRSSWSASLLTYYLADQNKENKMAGALEFMWRGKMYTGFWWGNTKETTWKASV
jgi:hypothetical protein